MPKGGVAGESRAQHWNPWQVDCIIGYFKFGQAPCHIHRIRVRFRACEYLWGCDSLNVVKSFYPQNDQVISHTTPSFPLFPTLPVLLPASSLPSLPCTSRIPANTINTCMQISVLLWVVTLAVNFCSVECIRYLPRWLSQYKVVKKQLYSQCVWSFELWYLCWHFHKHHNSTSIFTNSTLQLPAWKIVLC